MSMSIENNLASGGDENEISEPTTQVEKRRPDGIKNEQFRQLGVNSVEKSDNGIDDANISPVSLDQTVRNPRVLGNSAI